MDLRISVLECIKKGKILRIDLEDLSKIMDIRLLEYLKTRIENDTVVIDNLEGMALLYIILGGDPENVSQYIGWRSFEALVAGYLKLFEYDVAINIRAPPPRGFEADVIGVNIFKNLALVIDCKQWRVNRRSHLAKAVKDMEVRIDRIRAKCFIAIRKMPTLSRVRYLSPLIVTLRISQHIVINGIPIVPIYKLSNYLSNIDSYIDELEIKRYENPCFLR